MGNSANFFKDVSKNRKLIRKIVKPRQSYIICTPNRDNLAVDLIRCTHVCRYHKYPRRTSYTNGFLAPRGMCIDLFHAAYPYCLSLLYGAAYIKKVIVYCPNPDANVSIEIRKRPAKTRYFRNLMARLFAKLGYNIECPDVNITMTVRKDANVSCLYTYKSGRKFKFNIWLGREVCPATFDALYPSIHNIMRDGGIPWSPEKKSGNEVVCPDPKSNITMSIKKME